MENYNYYSYLTAAISYLVLTLLSLMGVKKNPVVIPLVTALFFSFVWAGYSAFLIHDNKSFTSISLTLEIIRNIVWFLLLSVFISRQQFTKNYLLLVKSRFANGLIVLILISLIVEVFDNARYPLQQLLGQDPRLFTHVIFAVIGLMLVEQVYRNATQ